MRVVSRFAGWRVIVLLVLLASVPTQIQAAQRPNVVVILTDDQGWGDLSLNGNKNLATPEIDALARAGTCFYFS